MGLGEKSNRYYHKLRPQSVRPQSFLNRISSLHSLLISSHFVRELSYQYDFEDITHDCLWTGVVRCLRIRQRGDLSETGKSAGNSSELQINNLWPGCFVKDKRYEETNKEYSTIMLMLVKDDRGKATAWHLVCFQMTCRHVSDEKQSLFSVCVLYPVCSLHFVLTDWGSMWQYRFDSLPRRYFMLCFTQYHFGLWGTAGRK